jgi:hypothetical protein
VLEKAVSKSLRPFLKSHISNRRISQSYFRYLSETLVDSKGNSISVYLRPEQVDDFLASGENSKFSVVFIGSSDESISMSQYVRLSNRPDSTTYVQNLNFPETLNLRLLPIGVEDLSWAKNGMPWNFRTGLALKPKSERILVGPFGKTHPERSELLKLTANLTDPKIVRIPNRVASWRYASLASNFRFVACPRGNGIDTHRFWETLYRGSIPIVVASEWSRNLDRYKVPFIALKSWEEMLGLEPKASLPTQPIDHFFLRPEYWRKRLIENDG